MGAASPASVERLDLDRIREALRLLGTPPPEGRPAAVRALRDALSGYGTVRALLERAPEGARDGFVRLAHDGPATVQELLGRGWWGRGLLPPPLDWLQRRALVLVAGDGKVHSTAEARQGFVALTLNVASAVPDDAAALRVQDAGAVVVAPSTSALDLALAVEEAGLRAVAPNVAVSSEPAERVRAALRSAGMRLDADDGAVPASEAEPALPGTPEEAVGPGSVRSLLGRAVTEARQVRLEYYASSRGGAATERVVDPWEFRDDLLRGWCHLRRDERTFAVDRIGRAVLLASTIEHQPA